MDIRIEPYLDAYKDDVIDLSMSIYEEFNLQTTPQKQADLQDDIVALCKKGNGQFWVARNEKHFLGTLALLDLGNGQGALRKMFVHKTHRGKEKKVAHTLLKTCLHWCGHKNINELYLGTRSVFLAAHKFYIQNAFGEIKEHQLPKTFPIMQDDTKFYAYHLK